MAAARLLGLWAAGAAVVRGASGSCKDGADGSCAARTPAVGGDHLLLQVGSRGGMGVGLHRPVCEKLPDVKKQCSSDGCTVLAGAMQDRSCAQYCASVGYACVAAWDETKDDCEVREVLTCESSGIQTSDLLCQCAPPGAAAAVAPMSEKTWGGGDLELSTFFWNVHWECSLAANGASRSCKSRIGSRFAELARQANAQIVASIELSDGPSNPASLAAFGLEGWTQVNGPCASGDGGDSAALAFAPGWIVEASGGGCLRWDWDTRAFAVARVRPPTPVQGCPSLCVVAIHAPHSSINRGKDVVASVCGSAVERCAVAMGDWNVPASGVAGLWASLIGGGGPGEARPDERTCCYPESSHYGVFDHLATNVPGARHDGQTVHPYQLLEENPVKQHRAVSARLVLPGASGSAVMQALEA